MSTGHEIPLFFFGRTSHDKELIHSRHYNSHNQSDKPSKPRRVNHQQTHTGINDSTHARNVFTGIVGSSVLATAARTSA